MVGRARCATKHPISPYFLAHYFFCPAVDFFNHLNMLYGTITEFCTPQEVRSRSMPANPRFASLNLPRALTVPGDVCRPKVIVRERMHWRHSDRDIIRYEYLWEDGVKYKRPTKLSAPEYVDALMNWAQSLLDNEKYFPNQIGAEYWKPSLRPFIALLIVSRLGIPFPKDFRDTVRTIFRRLFRVYAHLYSNHFDQICALGIEGTPGRLCTGGLPADPPASSS